MASVLILFGIFAILIHNIVKADHGVSFVYINSLKEVHIIKKGNIGEDKVPDALSCSIFCVRTDQCNSFFYNHDNHSCVLQKDVLSPTPGSTTKWKYWYKKGAKPKTDEEKQRKKKLARVVVTPRFAETGRPYFEIHVHNGFMKPFSTFSTRAIYHLDDVYYSWSTGRMFGATNKINGGELYILPNRFRDEPTTHRRNIKITGMDGDEDKKLLFLTTEISFKGLARMTTEGDNYSENSDKFKAILKTTCTPSDCSADPRRELVYISCQDRIISVNYSGAEDKRLKINDHSIFTLAIDPEEDVLYYSSGKMIRRSNRFKNETYNVDTCEKQVFKLVYTGRHVVLTQKDTNVMYKYNVRHNNRKTKIVVKSIKSYHTLLMCLVP